MPQPLVEGKPSAAATEAKRRGLVYGGFGQWVDAARVVRGKTVDGQFVPVTGDGEEEDTQDKGRVAILDVDANLFVAPARSPAVRQYIDFLYKLANSGTPLVLLLGKPMVEKALQVFSHVNALKKARVVPYTTTDSNLKRGFVGKLLKSGYSQVYYFDKDPKAIRAVDSLKATYNRSGAQVFTHVAPSIRSLSREHR